VNGTSKHRTCAGPVRLYRPSTPSSPSPARYIDRSNRAGRILQRSQDVVVGDPLDPATKVGALITDKHFQVVSGYVDLGQREGASVALGGRRLVSDRGRYYSPTVLADVRGLTRDLSARLTSNAFATPIQAAQDRGDSLRRRAIRREDGGGADRHGEGHGVAEPVGEKELRHRVADVAFLEAEHTAGIEVGGEPQIGVDVHRALGPAGRARGIKPKAHVVARGRRGIRFALSTREQVFETATPAAVFARDDDVHQIRARPDQVGEFR